MLKAFLVVYLFVYRCSASDWYDKASKVAAQKQFYNEMLYEIHNTGPDDYMASSLRESFNYSESNRKADILIEFQRLLKNSDQCQHKKFKDCLRESEKYVAKVDRCELPTESCNNKERYSRIDGFCNNLKNANTGRVNMPFVQSGH